MMTGNVLEIEGARDSFVPKPFRGYVPFGNFNDIQKILESKIFYTIFVTGLSGNGKTLMIEEICSRINRELIRANITIETDEDDLIGGFRLLRGETVWQDGPVITAMKRGAVLLLDEVDLASNKIMCLQPVLEGKSIYLKKINEVVHPAEGFNIVATANTKGKGSDDGRFVGTMILNEAFLERFSVTFEQDYPDPKIEKSILDKILKKYEKENEEFTSMLVDWASKIRESFRDGAVNEIISTRRLVHIIEAYNIFEDKLKAIELCLNRFDDETKSSFLSFYTKIDELVTTQKAKIKAEKNQRTAKVKLKSNETVEEFPF